MGEETAFMLGEAHESPEAENPHKAFRRRKKQLYALIRKQMEFYFSDSNLTKDRFLGKLIQEDPCVDLSIFTKFNKIRTLTTNVSDIAKALRNSELLSVTEDGTMVFRTKPVQQKENIDDCTIYVEQLPPDADHDWLRDVFTAYGNVAYVSIPKYRTSGKIKGFAFVEFETPEEASKTLEAFGARGCRLSSEIAPEKLRSIATFEPDEGGNAEEKNRSDFSEREDKYQEKERESDSIQCKRKRRFSHKESKEDTKGTENELQEGESKTKIIRNKDIKGQSFSEEGMKEVEKDKEHKEENYDHIKKKNRKSHEEKTKFVKEDENESNTNVKQKQKKPAEENMDVEVNPDAIQKQKKHLEEQHTSEVQLEDNIKRKRKKKQEDGMVQEDSEDSIPLKKIKVGTAEDEEITSTEETQPDHTVKKKIKREVEEEHEENANAEESVSENKNENIAEERGGENIEEDAAKRKRKRKKKKKNKKDKQDTDASSLQILSKREWKRLRNKYLDLQRAKMKCLKQYLSKQHWSNSVPQYNGDIPESESKVNQPRISFTPGVIVQAVLDEPVTDIRKFKADTKTLPDVQYVDVLQGANEAYIRCSTAGGAKQLVSNNPWVSSVILNGEAETAYWNKIMTDRKVKFSNKILSKQRGRDKILRRAERELGKHIKFDD